MDDNIVELIKSNIDSFKPILYMQLDKVIDDYIKDTRDTAIATNGWCEYCGVEVDHNYIYCPMCGRRLIRE